MLDEGDKVTILAVPLVDLARDMVKRCKELKIRAIHWQSGEERTAKITIVTVNAHNTVEFHKYASDLHNMGLLSRIIYDEIHFALTFNFRPEMNDLWTLMLSVQIIGLTATLLVMLESKLKLKMIMPNTKFIRISTNQTTTQYGLFMMNPGESDEDFIVKIVKELKITMSQGKKILIYARAIQTYQRL